MIVSTCPIATINSPIEKVWELLAEPANYDLWWEAHTRSIVAEGCAQAGQKGPCQSGRIPERGGKARRYFKLEAVGEQVLKETLGQQKRLAEAAEGAW